MTHHHMHQPHMRVMTNALQMSRHNNLLFADLTHSRHQMSCHQTQGQRLGKRSRPLGTMVKSRSCCRLIRTTQVSGMTPHQDPVWHYKVIFTTSSIVETSAVDWPLSKLSFRMKITQCKSCFLLCVVKVLPFLHRLHPYSFRGLMLHLLLATFPRLSTRSSGKGPSRTLSTRWGGTMPVQDHHFDMFAFAPRIQLVWYYQGVGGGKQ